MNDLGITNYWWFFVKKIVMFQLLSHYDIVNIYDILMCIFTGCKNIYRLQWTKKNLFEKLFPEINFMFDLLLILIRFCENCLEIEIPKDLDIQTKLVTLKKFREINLRHKSWANDDFTEFSLNDMQNSWMQGSKI